MSYDLMVFDPSAPPRDRAGFMAWYEDQMRWSEVQGFSHPEITTPGLHLWFLDMIQEFPSLGGAVDDEVDHPRLTGYSFGQSIIYADFRWSGAIHARRLVFDLARKHNVGFFDVSGEDGQVWIPGPNGDYQCVHTSTV